MKWRQTEYREFRRPDVKTPVESMGLSESTAERKYGTPWETRMQATRDFLGWTDLVEPKAKDGYYYPSRKTPHYHPDYITQLFAVVGNDNSLFRLRGPYLFAESLTHEGFLEDGGKTKGDATDTDSYTDITTEKVISSGGGAVSNYAESFMSVRYASTPYRILKDTDFAQLASVALGQNAPPAGPRGLDESVCLRYVWPKMISSPKYQTVPTKDSFSFAIDNQFITLTQVVLLCEADIILKWFNVPQRLFDMQLVQSLIGKCNKYDFGHPLMPLGMFPKGTLVFISPDVEPYPRATGEMYVNVTYRLRYYPYGANRFYRPDAKTSGTTPTGQAEVNHGPGYYWATRRYPSVSGRAVPENQIDALPAGVNVLLFPYGDFRNMFRARVDLNDRTKLDPAMPVIVN